MRNDEEHLVEEWKRISGLFKKKKSFPQNVYIMLLNIWETQLNIKH